ncbi:SsgA family sporulation/cell division regulator [Streptomyces kunmingensis]|uniref:SsgA family sporulation/cell division regulator n=1 Tax=Streptomyces kunmingensis TaxID=68225 RepID=A0ABU6CB45_9ACTN|nr:SsgA family sporulation/cell division regulator [Streptomyces kunmingensis]MEB3961699.1 SsgA family sporulation/cell division regulator [Streptomyces kunmingensis]
MHRDQSPLSARSAPGPVPPLHLELDQMQDEFTRVPVRAKFRFDPGMPAVITFELLAARGPSLIWHLGRGLLHRGLTAMSGAGDVRMWPTLPGERSSSWLMLASHEVEALFELPTESLATWLDATYRVVPSDAEMADLNWDGFLTSLLDGGRPPSA